MLGFDACSCPNDLAEVQNAEANKIQIKIRCLQIAIFFLILN